MEETVDVFIARIARRTNELDAFGVNFCLVERNHEIRGELTEVCGRKKLDVVISDARAVSGERFCVDEYSRI